VNLHSHSLIPVYSYAHPCTLSLVNLHSHSLIPVYSYAHPCALSLVNLHSHSLIPVYSYAHPCHTTPREPSFAFAHSGFEPFESKRFSLNKKSRPLFKVDSFSEVPSGLLVRASTHTFPREPSFAFAHSGLLVRASMRTFPREPSFAFAHSGLLVRASMRTFPREPSFAFAHSGIEPFESIYVVINKKSRPLFKVDSFFEVPSGLLVRASMHTFPREPSFASLIPVYSYAHPCRTTPREPSFTFAHSGFEPFESKRFSLNKKSRPLFKVDSFFEVPSGLLVRASMRTFPREPSFTFAHSGLLVRASLPHHPS
jgi:hypothetical protein